MKKLNIDHLEDVMDDMNDMQMDMEEMNEIMSRSYAIDDINEDDLEAELAELDQEMLEENMKSSSMKTPVYLPGQPHDEPLIEHS
jgi:charged multivesicular body protein 5